MASDTVTSPLSVEKRPRRPNSGSFKPGFDSRRHVFTHAERKLGYSRALLGCGKCSDVRVLAWVWRKVRSYYRKVKRKAKAG